MVLRRSHMELGVTTILFCLSDILIYQIKNWKKKKPLGSQGANAVVNLDTVCGKNLRLFSDTSCMLLGNHLLFLTLSFLMYKIRIPTPTLLFE